ncbi:hypothetical protein [Komagataeibacter sp. FXV3]|uniref:hypothetical protein n=1 Tax=Komagataeibacter sp. FXV3 TaxID=2608998 RepID=UPI00187B3DE6|nr:hypothetical protein [Komagataeibacter sp. FXV3]MBE7731311.1 hypothetical protein [Komagataeibacter sp. FXV3]
MVSTILGGMLECSFIRKITADLDPDQLHTKHPYYRSLQREGEKTAFTRSSTVIALSENTFLPGVDWSTTMLGENAPKMEEYAWREDWNQKGKRDEWEKFAELVVDDDTFGAFLHAVIPSVPPVDDEIDPPKLIRKFKIDYIVRILCQVDSAERNSSLLFMPQQDEEIVRRISSFAASCSSPPPFALPIFDNNYRDSDARSITLLAFQPPDALSLLPVRSDLAVRRYAERVMELWSETDPIRRERAAVQAMRDVLRADSVRDRVGYVFEASAWVLKGLGYFGVPLVGAIGDARDVAELAREREQRSNNWMLIRTMMNDISLHDYLERTGNM